VTDARTVITHVEPLTGYWVRLTFGDGSIHEVDLGDTLARGGVFAQIRDDRATFEAVTVDEYGTIAWPGDVELDPDVLRGDREPASGRPYPRRIIQPA
jgi:hypothetical protein